MRTIRTIALSIVVILLGSFMQSLPAHAQALLRVGVTLNEIDCTGVIEIQNIGTRAPAVQLGGILAQVGQDAHTVCYPVVGVEVGERCIVAPNMQGEEQIAIFRNIRQRYSLSGFIGSIEPQPPGEVLTSRRSIVVENACPNDIKLDGKECEILGLNLPCQPFGLQPPP
jgi:hypothetical protein